MNRTRIRTYAVVVLLVASTAATVGPAAQRPDDRTVASQQGAPEDVTAGEWFAGTVGSERAAVSGRLRVAAFERAYEAADTDSDRAAVSAGYLQRAERRLASLDERRNELRERRDAGDLSEGAYRAYLQRVRGDVDALVWLAETIENRTEGLAADQRREHGVTEADVDAFEADALALRESLPAPWAEPDGSVYEDVEAFVDGFDQRGDGGGVADRLAGERITFEVATTDGPVTVSFTVGGDGRVTDVAAGAHADPTVRIHTDRETLGDLARADDPARRLQRAVEDDDVSFRGIGALKRLEWGAIELFSDAA